MGYASSFRNATSGGHGIGSSFGGSMFGADEDTEEWDSYDWAEYRDSTRPLGLSAGTSDRPEVLKNGNAWTESWMDDSPTSKDEDRPPYYTVDTDGNMEYYSDLDEMETALLWAAGRLPDDDDSVYGERESKWVNAYVDLGTIDYADDSTQSALISWVQNPGEVSVYEPQSNTTSLGYVKDGVDILRKIGA
jgi:hypothetical protein